MTEEKSNKGNVFLVCKYCDEISVGKESFCSICDKCEVCCIIEDNQFIQTSELKKTCMNCYTLDVKNDDKSCIVCMDENREYSFIPCGHKCLCLNCMIDNKFVKCPVCRIDFQSICKIYD